MFARPVDDSFPIKAHFGDLGVQYDWSMDPDNGYWIPVKCHQGRGNHRGTDFDCPIGTVVKAMADGMIIAVKHENALDSKQGVGLFITQLVNDLGHDSWVVRYCHLKAAYTKVGDFVYKHQPIAESGNSGAVVSPYLHVDMTDLRRQYKAIQFE